VADDRLQVAIEIVAHGIVDRLAHNEMTQDDLRSDDYAEIGEHDWDRIWERIRNIPQRISPEEFEAAVEYLEGRAENDG
jgi:hypothetical protein